MIHNPSDELIGVILTPDRATASNMDEDVVRVSFACPEALKTFSVVLNKYGIMSQTSDHYHPLALEVALGGAISLNEKLSLLGVLLALTWECKAFSKPDGEFSVSFVAVRKA